ncbi:MAG: peptidase S1 [Planctomycetaceae bacterium]|nr:peptidase S1 [Planctomycetaceae bacterium]
MRNPFMPLLLVPTLVGGIVIGNQFDVWPVDSFAWAGGQSAGDDLDDVDASPLVAGSRTLAKIAALTTPSVVHIESEHTDSQTGIFAEEKGAGVIVSDPRGSGVVIVTNRHVVGEAALGDIAIHIHDGRVIRPKQKWSDRASDLAVLRVEGPDLQPARWGDSDETEIGHMVIAMGSPFGLSGSVTMGIISAKGRRSLNLQKGDGADLINQDFLQTDAAINPGNSGGPLIDMRGRVIGINTAIASKSGGNEGIGFSIPSNLIGRIVGQLLQKGKVQRAYLGVQLDPAFDEATAKRLKLDRVRGARVAIVYADTPAARANLKLDDVILSFGGVDVQDENHLILLVSLTEVGKKARLVVLRDGKEITITVALANRVEKS